MFTSGIVATRPRCGGQASCSPSSSFVSPLPPSHGRSPKFPQTGPVYFPSSSISTHLVSENVAQTSCKIPVFRSCVSIRRERIGFSVIQERSERGRQGLHFCASSTSNKSETVKCSVSESNALIPSDDPVGRGQSPIGSPLQQLNIEVRQFMDNSSAKDGMEEGLTAHIQIQAVPMYYPKLVWFAKSQEEETRYLDRAINATLAGAALSYAVIRVLTVDQDYWHGWTAYEIVRYAPLHNWFAYEETLKSHPVFAKMMISGIVYSVGDWIAQCYAGKPLLEVNRLRMFRSGLVGFCLHGSLSHYYYYVCEFLFPFKDWWVVPLKVAFDQTIWSGIWNSIYYITLGLLRFESPVNIWKELRSTFFPLLTAGWKLWPFAHIVTYGVIPVEQRLLWVDCVELVWVTILSMFANEKAEERLEAVAETETKLIVSSDIADESTSTD